MAVRVRTLNNMSPKYLGKLNATSYYFYSGSRKNMTDGTQPGPPYKKGNGLILLATTFEATPTKNVVLYGLGSPRRRFEGAFIPSAFGYHTSGTLPAHFSVGTQAAWLASHQGNMPKAWNKFKPGKPGVELGQALIELRQIPTLTGMVRGLSFFKNLGRNHLNIEFGWKPFLSDLMHTVETAHKMANTLAQLRKDNGKFIRRKGVLSSETLVTPIGVYGSTCYPQLTSEFYLNPVHPGSETQYWQETRRHWFSAAFRYWIPDIREPEWEPRALRKLMGLNPTPSLVWEVLPWSWLIDWFSNIGDVLNNVSGNAAENLAAKYAYLMSNLTVEKRAETRLTVVSQDPYKVEELTCSSKIKWEYKLRTAANPFGFGVTFASLSGRQMMILAALGLSRHG